MGSDPHPEKKDVKGAAWWKVDLTVTTIATACYLFSWLDRTNLGNARIAGLQHDLKLTPHQYSICLTFTFVPYIAAELPSNLLLKIVGPNRLLPGLLILWGLATTLQGIVRSFTGLLICRFFLGLFEGGLTPGLVLYLSTFYPREQLQRRVSIVLSTASLAGVFSGLLATAIVRMSGDAGRPGWAWIFILEGISTVIFGIFISFIMPSSPKDCRFLNEDEKTEIIEILRHDGAISADESFCWADVFKAFRAPHQLFLNVVSFFHGTMTYSLSYFVPSILLSLGYNRHSAQLMSVPPYLVAFFVTNLASFFADRYRCRGLVVILGNLLCVFGFAMFLCSHRHIVQYGSLFLTVVGANATSPAGITWAANNNAPHLKRATGIALVSICSNVGGILATWLLGFISHAPRYTKATQVLLAFSGGAVLFAGLNLGYLWNQNKLKAKIRASSIQSEERPDLGDRSAWFIYIL